MICTRRRHGAGRRTGIEPGTNGPRAATAGGAYAGVVLEVNASEGETVAAGAPVLRPTDPTQVEAEITVVEEDLFRW